MTTPACELTIELRPSRRLLQLLVAGHLAAAASLLLVDMDWLWRWAGWLFVVLHGVYVWRDSGWLRRLTQLKYSDGLCRVTSAHDAHQEGLGTSYFVTPWLVILQVSVAGRRRMLPLLKDSCHPNDLRRLRVFLRTNQSAS